MTYHGGCYYSLEILIPALKCAEILHLATIGWLTCSVVIMLIIFSATRHKKLNFY